MTLRCEMNTPKVEKEVLEAFKEFDSTHQNPKAGFEHGQWHVTCNTCGAQWNVNDAAGPGSYNGFDFEQVSDGDDYCDEHSGDDEEIESTRYVLIRVNVKHKRGVDPEDIINNSDYNITAHEDDEAEIVDTEMLDYYETHPGN